MLPPFSRSIFKLVFRGPLGGRGEKEGKGRGTKEGMGRERSPASFYNVTTAGM